MAKSTQWSGPVAVLVVTIAAAAEPALKPLAHAVAAVVFTWGVAGVVTRRARRSQPRQPGVGGPL